VAICRLAIVIYTIPSVMTNPRSWLQRSGHLRFVPLVPRGRPGPAGPSHRSSRCQPGRSLGHQSHQT
jgi:hypothetical protein